MSIVKRSSIPDVPNAAASENRGHRATTNGGEVRGSGAGSGGGGSPEDYDSDPQAGGGTFPPTSPPPEGDGADAPNHGSR